MNRSGARPGSAVAISVLAVGLLGLTGCSSSPPQISMDGPDFASVRALAEASDAVVIGVVEEKLGAERDNGGNPEVDDGGRPVGVPMAFFQLRTERTLKGSAPASLVVAWLDGSQADFGEDISELASGQRVALFLTHRTAGEAPGVTLVEDFWVPLSGDNGVLDAEAEAFVPRSPRLTGLRRPGDAGDPLSISDADLVAAVGP